MYIYLFSLSLSDTPPPRCLSLSLSLSYPLAYRSDLSGKQSGSLVICIWSHEVNNGESASFCLSYISISVILFLSIIISLYLYFSLSFFLPYPADLSGKEPGSLALRIWSHEEANGESVGGRVRDEIVGQVCDLKTKQNTCSYRGGSFTEFVPC
jgi:hypothetical protein